MTVGTCGSFTPDVSSTALVLQLHQTKDSLLSLPLQALFIHVYLTLFSTFASVWACLSCMACLYILPLRSIAV